VTRRLIVRRTRLTDPDQQRLWPDWRHHAFLTDLTGDAVDIDRFHRHHAVVELAIRDLKEGVGLDHVPSGNFHANSAWLQCAVLAHNLIRWTSELGNVRVEGELTVARTIRTRLISLPRAARQPRRTTHTPSPGPLAVGRHLHHRPSLAAPAATRSHLMSARGPAHRTHRTLSADNLNRTNP
jgi:Transposase DDE domain group 1